MESDSQTNRGLKRAHINRGLSQAAALSSSHLESPSTRRKKKDEAKADNKVSFRFLPLNLKSTHNGYSNSIP